MSQQAGRGLLSRQEARHDHRLFAGRHLRPLCAARRALSRQLHSRQADHRAAQHAGRRLPRRGDLGLQHRAADGTVLATADQSLSLQQAAGDKRIKFDTTKFIYIGNPNVENNTTAAWHTSGIKTIDDAKSREVTVGATGGSTSSQYPKAMNALIGTKFKIVLGYPGGNDVNLAMERGEVEVRGSNSWTSWKATRPRLARREEDQHPGADRARQGARPAGRAAADGPRHQRRGPSAAARCCRRRPTSAGRSSPRRRRRRSGSRRCARRSTRWCTIRRSSSRPGARSSTSSRPPARRCRRSSRR